MKKSVLGLLGFGAACAACCLPFVAPMLVATGLSGVLAFTLPGVTLEYLVCEVGPWIAASGLVVIVAAMLWRRAKEKAACGCEKVCVPNAR